MCSPAGGGGRSRILCADSLARILKAGRLKDMFRNFRRVAMGAGMHSRLSTIPRATLHSTAGDLVACRPMSRQVGSSSKWQIPRSHYWVILNSDAAIWEKAEASSVVLAVEA